jgi:hypothetical protein
MRCSNPPEGNPNMSTSAWLRRMHHRLDEIERARFLRKPDRENEVRAPRFSVVIDERVRLEFSAQPSRVSVNPGHGAAGRAAERGALVLELQIW